MTAAENGTVLVRVAHTRHFIRECVDEAQRNRRERRRAKKSHSALLQMRTPPDRRSIARILGSYARDLPRVGSGS